MCTCATDFDRSILLINDVDVLLHSKILLMFLSQDCIWIFVVMDFKIACLKLVHNRISRYSIDLFSENHLVKLALTNCNWFVNFQSWPLLNRDFPWTPTLTISTTNMKRYLSTRICTQLYYFFHHLVVFNQCVAMFPSHLRRSFLWLCCRQAVPLPLWKLLSVWPIWRATFL